MLHLLDRFFTKQKDVKFRVDRERERAVYLLVCRLVHFIVLLGRVGLFDESAALLLYEKGMVQPKQPVCIQFGEL